MSVLKGRTAFYDYSVSDVVEHNLREMLIYGLIERGAYTKVSLDSSYSTLQATYDPRYGVRKVYEGLGPSWVWQSGAGIPDGYEPLFQVSGVYVGSTFYGLATSGTYAHTIDYQHGRVIFNNSLPANSVVKCEYIINDVNVQLTSDNSWKTLVTQYMEKYLGGTTSAPSGISTSIKEDRVWLPALFIEVRGLDNSTGLELGGGEIQEFNAYFHVFAEESKTRNAIVDLLNSQINHTINLFDINETPPNFTQRGSVNPSGHEYPYFTNRDNGYFFTFCNVLETKGGAIQGSVDLFRGEVSMVLEIDRYISTY